VISHWDDDHIRGAAEIFANAPNARWVVSAALNTDEFKKLILAGRDPLCGTSTREFDRLFAELRKRKQSQRLESVGPAWASEGQLLWEKAGARVQVMAPSAATLTLAKHEIAGLLPIEGEKRRVVSQGRNQLSIVLSVQLGRHGVLLTGDLVATSNPDTGWDGVLRTAIPAAQAAHLVKIPHHGSEGAHHAGMWSNLLEVRPIAVTTTYNPSGLPKPTDRARIRELAGASYLTGVPGGTKSAHRSGDRTIRAVVPELRQMFSRLGHVRWRSRLDGSTTPTVEFFGAAFLDSAA
jgi:beta-lactamase superfamily II metal-dependent hydrolase